MFGVPPASRYVLTLDGTPAERIVAISDPWLIAV